MASERTDKKSDLKDQKKKKKNKGPGPFSQMKQVYTMTKQSDPNIGWIMLLVALVVLLAFVLLGVLLKNWITWTIIGIPLAILAAVLVMSRRAERAAFSQIEGQTGATGAAMSTLRRGWVIDQQPVRFNASQDLVFRAIGRPGIVLVTEGSQGRVGALVAQEKKHLKKVAPAVPVHVINAGNGEGQVPLKKVAHTMQKLEKKITNAEVHAISNRLQSINSMNLGIPKGIDPTRMRPDRKAMRGR